MRFGNFMAPFHPVGQNPTLAIERDLDLIVAMDDSNLSDLRRLRRDGTGAALRLFTDYAPGAGMDHVPDPYYTRDFDGCLDLVERAAEGLLDDIAKVG